MTMTSRLLSLFGFGVVILFGLSAPAQLTVDATGPHKSADFGTTGGSGGGVGRKLPLHVGIKVVGAPFNASDGKTVVEFTLTNFGRKDITIPVSPDPEDLETADSFRELALFITSDKRFEVRLQTGTHPGECFIKLYGSHTLSWTLATLAPGASVRVRAEVALPHISGIAATNTLFVAHAVMNENNIKNVDGKRVMVSREVGASMSREYTPQALLGASE